MAETHGDKDDDGDDDDSKSWPVMVYKKSAIT